MDEYWMEKSLEKIKRIMDRASISHKKIIKKCVLFAIDEIRDNIKKDMTEDEKFKEIIKEGLVKTKMAPYYSGYDLIKDENCNWYICTADNKPYCNIISAVFCYSLSDITDMFTLISPNKSIGIEFVRAAENVGKAFNRTIIVTCMENSPTGKEANYTLEDLVSSERYRISYEYYGYGMCDDAATYGAMYLYKRVTMPE